MIRRAAAEAEDDLNGQLCKYLSDRARSGFPMACFHHEERQTGRRRVDLSVLPSSKAIEAAIYESIYDPFLVIEGKRLPAPSRVKEARVRHGFDEKSGGIQRFRLCLHGRSVADAVLVGYVQSGEVASWLVTINGWITALSSSNDDTTCVWGDGDRLVGLRDDGRAKASRCESRHSRSGDAAAVASYPSLGRDADKRRKKRPEAEGRLVFNQGKQFGQRHGCERSRYRRVEGNAPDAI